MLSTPSVENHTHLGVPCFWLSIDLGCVRLLVNGWIVDYSARILRCFLRFPFQSQNLHLYSVTEIWGRQISSRWNFLCSQSGFRSGSGSGMVNLHPFNVMLYSFKTKLDTLLSKLGAFEIKINLFRIETSLSTVSVRVRIIFCSRNFQHGFLWNFSFICRNK